MPRFQHTLKESVSMSGIGLHGGSLVTMTLCPAPPDTGIVFRRCDLDPPKEIPAQAHLVGDTQMCSCLIDGAIKVATIEHIMSALYGLEIDNCIIDLSSPEIPIMDGSSAPFIFLLQSTGVVEQPALRRYLRIKQPIQVHDGDKFARFEPYHGYRLRFEIEFQHPALARSANTAQIEFSPERYIREVSRARTFGFMRDFELMRSKKLALGASLDNAVAVDDYRVMNHDGLRYDDEFVRHKILDAIGDLYLLGHPILGAYTAFKSGHGLNNQLARAVLADPTAYEITTLDRA
jgi:UDP-3-O-[3-hydroxymyristoyl] N-acetylglucosamine deacetylase